LSSSLWLNLHSLGISFVLYDLNEGHFKYFLNLIIMFRVLISYKYD
jgi:hypothetical protein